MWHFRVLQLMNLTDSRLEQGGCEKLDLALLSFFEQFRKIYVGDQVQKTSRVCLPCPVPSSSMLDIHEGSPIHRYTGGCLKCLV